MDNPMTFLFIGRSGCGKGTQVKLLKEYLEKNDTRKIAYAYAGEELRKLVNEEGLLVHELVKKTMADGKKQPDFLAIWAWASELIKKLDKNMHLVIDGSPRAEVEVRILDEAFEFLNRKNIYPILLEVNEEWATEHLKERGRSDDTDKGIKGRMNFFRNHVVPAINYYDNRSKNNIIRINGEQTIKEVHQEIIKKIFKKK